MLLSLSKFPLHSPQLYTPSPFQPSPSSILIYAPPLFESWPDSLKRCAPTHTPSTLSTFIPPPSPNPLSSHQHNFSQSKTPPPHRQAVHTPPPTTTTSQQPYPEQPPLTSSPLSLSPASHPPRNLCPFPPKAPPKVPSILPQSSSTPPLLPPPPSTDSPFPCGHGIRAGYRGGSDHDPLRMAGGRRNGGDVQKDHGLEFLHLVEDPFGGTGCGGNGMVLWVLTREGGCSC